MAVEYVQQNETIDALAYRLYGNTDAVATLYRLNPGLAQLGVQLPQGTRVTLPDSQQRTASQRRAKIRLWD